jgi:antitoxin component YwqK of YwqJK toxin-antitoxin module
MEDGETEQCYLCYGPASAEDPFAVDPKPCQCTGSIVLHKGCLQQLMSRSATCSICKSAYNLVYLATEGEYVVKYMIDHKIKYKINAAGQKDGPFEIWYWNEQVQGRIKQRCFYVADKREGLDEQWYANGNRWHRYSVVGGRREGLYEAWHENGQLWIRCNYMANKLEGLYKSFYMSGSLLYKYNLVDGKREGLYEHWHQNGPLVARGNYVGGELHGIYEEWHENGQLKSRRTAVNGQLDGWLEEWDEAGQLKRKSYYIEGRKTARRGGSMHLNTRESDRAFDAWLRGQLRGVNAL